ncbi:VCBS repeat-containing protein [Spongiimicrobium sp. 3-5]|uniref:VCBS repeat-containing protein n=1 Tax=Spongiimicrobium sp. 3-5 TaxID=3332596 RepID=UPI00397F52AA
MFNTTLQRLLTISSFSLIVSLVGCNKTAEHLFKEHTSENSGVSFSNTLVLDETLSVLEFEYMYNGAGVAVADFDKDGLQDLYFTGNMTSNRLYRNLGNWQFEDLTEQANVGSTNWSNGVAIVDINQDGYQDIYVCKGGPRTSTGADRANLLFINKGLKEGKLAFEEEAEKWGLADESYSVQAAFLDYDGDGDLDMYLLSNALVDFNRNTTRPKDRTGKAPSVDKLFRNNGDQTFSDVSIEAGILMEGFGLGVEVFDINMDGWPDIYVSNDFLTDDLLYVNQQNGTFLNEISTYFKHLTYNGMGNDIADINNDGLMDVVVLDMLPPDNERWKLTMMGNNYDQFQNSISDGYQPQYIRNTLQLNNGNGSFSEVGQIAGISATEWSWSALLADFDHDGLKDLGITNGYRQDITNLDFMVYGNQVLTMGTEETNRKQRIEELNKLPGIKTHNFFFKNEGDLQFKDISEEAGFTKPTYSNGMAYGDLDNDGDLDLVMNNIDDPASLFENNTVSDQTHNYIKFKFKGEAPNLAGIGSQVTLHYQGKVQKQYFTPYRGYLSTVEHSLHFGLGNTVRLDSVIVTWPNGNREVLQDVSTNKEITLKIKDAIPYQTKQKYTAPTLFQQMDSTALHAYKHREDPFVDFKIQALLPHMHSRNGPGLAVADVNGDGMEDCYIGGATGQPGTLMIQSENQSFQKLSFPQKQQEDMGTLFFDADNDGDQDLYVVSGGSTHKENSPLYQDRLYENDGTGAFTEIRALPEFAVSGSVVTAADYNKDGKLDLFVGGRVRPGAYPLAPASYLLKNNSAENGISFIKDDQAVSTLFEELGMVTGALWTDFNNDTWQDLVVVGEFMAIRFFENQQGKLVEITKQTGLEHTSGWWNNIVSGDFDNDGDTDYILGNLGLNSRYHASSEEPLCIYANDYDKNGQIDPVMCYYIDGENYVAHSRNDLIDQINAMRARFRTYSDYAKATFEESFLKQELEDAYVVKSETFANSYLENLGDGKFKLTALPRPAQIAPMYGMMVGDYNNDDHLDLLAVGNFYSGEVFSGQYDAAIGWLLAGNGNGGFKSVGVEQSGFFVPGDAKGLARLYAEGKEVAMATINNGPLAVYTFPRPQQKIYTAKSQDVYAIIQYANGQQQKVEFNYGGSYLSQPSRSMPIPNNAKTVTIIDVEGEQTQIFPAQ